ncbi:MAG: hypothetical protein DYG92_01115 [Leptolyngbya sp. PLA1]|nr:hypothetical protein [Leptolyngbya sp. PLA1]
MALVLAGIDEAGYGPTLGPLCVGFAAFRLPDRAGTSTPNLWDLLSAGVCREPGRGGSHDPKGRIAIGDSKKLKLSNAVRTTHPLVHLERGVMSFLRVHASFIPAHDGELFDALGVASAWHPCYQGAPRPLPVTGTAGEVAIAANLLARALLRAEVTVAGLACDVTPEPLFNACVRESGSKAQTVARAMGRHLRRVWALATPEDRVGIACDRLGGRADYSDLLREALPGVEVSTLEESATRSRYVLAGADGRRGGIAFLTEGEDAHMPIALASMIAKYTRELLMARFNEFWSACHLQLEGKPLKPTAGYALDARRWLDEVGRTMSDADRSMLVRIA